MNKQHTEGVILQVIPFQENDRILTFFSPDQGIGKLLMKGAQRSRNRAAFAPLTKGDFVYKSNGSELLLCQEATPIEQYLPLRESLERIEAACDLLHAIQKSQMPGKPAPELYALLVRYLEAMTAGKDCLLLVASFRLKVLKHEGLLRIHEECTTCQQPLKGQYISNGEGYCPQHVPPQALFLEENEVLQMAHLAFCRSMTELLKAGSSPTFANKIKSLFEEEIADFHC